MADYFNDWGGYSDTLLDLQNRILTGQEVSPEEFKLWFESPAGYNRPYQGEDQEGVTSGVTTQQEQAQAQPDFGETLVNLAAAGVLGYGALDAFGGLGGTTDFVPSITAESAAAEGSYATLEEALAASLYPEAAGFVPSITAESAAAEASYPTAEASMEASLYPAAAPGGGGLPISPTTALKGAQLANSLLNSGNKFPNLFGGQGGSLFGQGSTPGGSSYMRKARQPMQQPAFLGEQGQQPLGSVEDAMFNEQLAGKREDVSNRARQMAAQLRGRPTTFGFRSG